MDIWDATIVGKWYKDNAPKTQYMLQRHVNWPSYCRPGVSNSFWVAGHIGPYWSNGNLRWAEASARAHTHSAKCNYFTYIYIGYYTYRYTYICVCVYECMCMSPELTGLSPLSTHMSTKLSAISPKLADMSSTWTRRSPMLAHVRPSLLIRNQYWQLWVKIGSYGN